ncbi:diguanylate cyclase [Lichenibacterium ramalinae]|uniref:Diguanylate cyclase n=2 Tax=Lichenibacterium ramalinae TaxID=2316527 RepID=A0A4V1RIG0_9HYPH|nr:diguanylate cyclase [Lichenibacterium ramalinae]
MQDGHDSPDASRVAAADDARMFDLAPVSLWLEDYSGIRDLFAGWRRSGVTDLRAFLAADPARISACSARIQVLKVNRRTLDMFEARDRDHLVANLGGIFSGDMLTAFVDELVQLWDGHSTFSGLTVNYSLSGRRIDVQLSGAVLPGHEDRWDRVMVSLEDVTERESARRRLADSGDYARGLFEHSPVSLWVEDFSAIKSLIDPLRERGITDFRTFTDVHPDFVERCMMEIRVIEVNRHTLDLFEAGDQPTLLARLGDVFRDDMRGHFREQLIDLWDGKLFQRREVVNYTLSGQALHLHLQFSVFPGHEKDWSLVQVALTDITARKKAEAYLEFLGNHDVLTKLYNRTFYVEELNRLQRRGPSPVSLIVIDLDGLKAANDGSGHEAGDSLLRRAAEVISSAIAKPCHAARIGGDEFAVILPGLDTEAAAQVVVDIEDLQAMNNQFYPGIALRLSMGHATSQAGERLEETARRADAAMYDAKRRRYAQEEQDRRSHGSA